MNPFETKPQAPDIRKCSHCRDMGFTLPPEFHSTSPGIPADVLYKYGIPCGQCSEGAVFRQHQKLWNLPITKPENVREFRERDKRLSAPPPPAMSDPTPRKQPGQANRKEP